MCLLAPETKPFLGQWANVWNHLCVFSLSYSFRSFLLSKDGNPNKRNMHNETSLHLLCMGPQILTSEGALQPRIARPYEDQRRRAECLQIILAWTGAKLDHGEYESANINATDNKKNTCLHYAAASGMKTCVEVRFQTLVVFFSVGCEIFSSMTFMCRWKAPEIETAEPH